MLCIVWTPINIQNTILIITAIFIAAYVVVNFLQWLTDKDSLKIEREKNRIERAKAEPIIAKLGTGETSGKFLKFFHQNTGATISSVIFNCDDADSIQLTNEQGTALGVWEHGHKAYIHIRPSPSLGVDAMRASYSVTMHYRNALDETCKKLLIFKTGTMTLYPEDH